jgi:hypothetical protein
MAAYVRLEINNLSGGVDPVRSPFMQLAGKCSQARPDLIRFGLRQGIDDHAPIAVVPGTTSGGVDATEPNYNWKFNHNAY